MPPKIKRVCAHLGCHELTTEHYCPGCKEKYGKQDQRFYNQKRGSAARRGYGYKWSKESKRLQDRAENQFCYIKGPNCNQFVECIDHIIPPNGPNDPMFKDPLNRAPACNWCNSVFKRDKTIKQLIEKESAYYQDIGYNPMDWLKERGLYY
jgi:5-methylcytosine-specific restriction protein A